MSRFKGWTPETVAEHRHAQAMERYRDARWPLPPVPVVGEANARDVPTLTEAVKPSKYRNEKTGRYASKREAARAAELRLLERAGEISDLREQTRWLLIPKQEGERACFYVSDFDYRDRYGELVVEDVKSVVTKTPAYVIKRKLMLMVHGVRVREIA